MVNHYRCAIVFGQCGAFPDIQIHWSVLPAIVGCTDRLEKNPTGWLYRNRSIDQLLYSQPVHAWIEISPVQWGIPINLWLATVGLHGILQSSGDILMIETSKAECKNYRLQTKAKSKHCKYCSMLPFFYIEGLPRMMPEPIWWLPSVDKKHGPWEWEQSRANSSGVNWTDIIAPDCTNWTDNKMLSKGIFKRPKESKKEKKVNCQVYIQLEEKVLGLCTA